jgi:hypothetical protein
MHVVNINVVKKNNYMVWYDLAVIKLSHLFESLDKMGLVRRFDATLRLWVNTGTVNVTVTSPEVANSNYVLTAMCAVMVIR